MKEARGREERHLDGLEHRGTNVADSLRSLAVLLAKLMISESVSAAGAARE
jgi:hypothetical protein